MKKAKRVILIGLDGSGKSANLNKMKEDERFKGYSFVWARWKPFLLRPLYAVLNRKKNKSDDNMRESVKKDYDKNNGIKKKIFKSRFIRFIWRHLATLDYFLVIRFKTLIKRIKKKDIVFDRYYPDLFIDLGVNFGEPPEKIFKTIEKKKWLFPKTDGYFYIRVSPEICYKRKEDIASVDYLEKRYAVYELLKERKDFTVIDGEKLFEEVYSDLTDIILKKI